MSGGGTGIVSEHLVIVDVEATNVLRMNVERMIATFHAETMAAELGGGGDGYDSRRLLDGSGW